MGLASCQIMRKTDKWKLLHLWSIRRNYTLPLSMLSASIHYKNRTAFLISFVRWQLLNCHEQNISILRSTLKLELMLQDIEKSLCTAAPEVSNRFPFYSNAHFTCSVIQETQQQEFNPICDLQQILKFKWFKQSCMRYLFFLAGLKKMCLEQTKHKFDKNRSLLHLSFSCL